MVLEAIDSNRPWFYSEDERKMMRAALAVPRRTSVWIAKCVNQPNIYSAAKGLGTTPGDDGVHAFATTMAFGSLALQVVSIKTPAAIPENVAVTYDVREGPWDQTLVQMWPTSQNSRTWPPGLWSLWRIWIGCAHRALKSHNALIQSRCVGRLTRRMQSMPMHAVRF